MYDNYCSKNTQKHEDINQLKLNDRAMLPAPISLDADISGNVVNLVKSIPYSRVCVKYPGMRIGDVIELRWVYPSLPSSRQYFSIKASVENIQAHFFFIHYSLEEYSKDISIYYAITSSDGSAIKYSDALDLSFNVAPLKGNVEVKGYRTYTLRPHSQSLTFYDKEIAIKSVSDYFSPTGRGEVIGIDASYSLYLENLRGAQPGPTETRLQTEIDGFYFEVRGIEPVSPPKYNLLWPKIGPIVVQYPSYPPDGTKSPFGCGLWLKKSIFMLSGTYVIAAGPLAVLKAGIDREPFMYIELPTPLTINIKKS